jgi:hypothetical protein
MYGGYLAVGEFVSFFPLVMCLPLAYVYVGYLVHPSR